MCVVAPELGRVVHHPRVNRDSSAFWQNAIANRQAACGRYTRETHGDGAEDAQCLLDAGLQESEPRLVSMW
jgi:hypothetical protein